LIKCKDSFDRPCSETATNSDFSAKLQSAWPNTAPKRLVKAL